MNILLITETQEWSTVASGLIQRGHSVGLVSTVSDRSNDNGTWHYSTHDFVRALEVEEPEVVVCWTDYSVLPLSMIVSLCDDHRVRQFVTIGTTPVMLPRNHMTHTHLQSTEGSQLLKLI